MLLGRAQPPQTTPAHRGGASARPPNHSQKFCSWGGPLNNRRCGLRREMKRPVRREIRREIRNKMWRETMEMRRKMKYCYYYC